MSLGPSFDDLMDRLRAGDEAAAREVFRRFAGRLIGLAHGRLDRLVRAKVDAEDVVQSAFKSFFLGQAAGRFDLGDWDGLWGLLVCITLRKCGRAVRRFHVASRDVRREAPAADVGAAGVAWDALAAEPTPAEAAMLAETVEQFLGALPPRDRRIFELRLQGCTIPEISAAVGRTEYTVEGVLRKVRRRLHDLHGGAGGAP
jgi:RNA polymerase sigma-70 factor (ECF subfamily)